MTDNIDVNKLKIILAEFAKVRDWEKFHTPKNLSMAMSAEAGELLEIFQWLTEEESISIKDNVLLKEEVGYELADVILYCIRLADILDIHLSKAISNKIVINNDRYPAEKVKGSAKKYSKRS